MSENYAASPRITVFPATLNRFTATPIAEKRKRRVAAYARVSTNSDEQKTSYEAQVSYYTDSSALSRTGISYRFTRTRVLPAPAPSAESGSTT